MADEIGASNTILKILSGIQTGAEVALAVGDYTLGSGGQDDIQLVDVSLKPGHAKLRVSPGKIEISAASGSLKTTNGVSLEPNSDWQEIEPLDIITAGTTKFALGPTTALWASITDMGDPAAAAGTASAKAAPPPKAGTAHAWVPRGRQLVLPVLALVVLLGFAAWQLSAARVDQFVLNRSLTISDVELIRNAIAKLPFTRPVEVRQDVDSTIYVSGFVETPVERRAIIGAVEKTAVPARLRIWVLESIRAEVDNLISSEDVKVTYQLSPNGELTFEGVILNAAAAVKFVGLVKDRVLGLARVDSRIKTAETLLVEVEKLAQLSQLGSWVLLRVDNNLIEANGTIPLEKIDSWVGFLQAYAKRFAKDIPLRSYVRLQDAAGPAGAGAQSDRRDQAIVIGGKSPAGGDIELDIDRLRQGMYQPHDVFVNSPTRDGGDNSGQDRKRDNPISGSTSSSDRLMLTDALATTVSVKPASQTEVTTVGGTEQKATDDNAASYENPSSVGTGASQSTVVVAENAPRAATPPVGKAELSDPAKTLLSQWLDNKLSPGSSGQAFKKAIDVLYTRENPGAPTDADRQRFVDRYLPLFNARLPADGTGACWSDSQLRPQSIPAVLFWLDLLSVSETVTLSSFDQNMQTLVLEAALNPRRTAECVKRLKTDAGLSSRSLYLAEIARNPSFVRFITRDLKPFTLDITGASLEVGTRFIQIRSGRKLTEGAAPDGGSRLTLIGELGVAIQIKDGMSSVIFGPDLSWFIE